MKTNFSRDEIEWIDSIEIDSRRKVLTSEAVENPKASLLRAGVIKETPKGLVVATEYKDMFHVKQLPRKPKPKPEPEPKPKPEPKPVAKNPRIRGFDRIASKVTIRETDVGGLNDLVRCLAIHGKAYKAIVENLCRGLETKDIAEAIECGNVAREVFRQEVAQNQSDHMGQLYIHATSRAQQMQVRLMRLAQKECRVFDDVRAKCGDDIRSVVFSGPMDSVVAAATMYTYSTDIAHRYAKKTVSEHAHKSNETKRLYAKALTEAMGWLD